MTKNLRKICDEANEYVTKWFDSIEFEGRMEDHKHMDGEEVMYEQGENIKTALETLPAALDLIDKLEKALLIMSGYFGKPVKISMKELGRDAYIELPMKVRIGDIREFQEALAAVKEFKGE